MKRILLLLLIAGTILLFKQRDQPITHAAAPDAAPEEISTGFGPRGLALNDTHVFVANRGFGESCAYDPGQSMTVLRRVNMGGGGELSLLERCDFHPKGLIADNQYVYFRDGDNDIKRIPVSGGATELIATDTCCGGFTQDATHLYWANNGAAGDNDEIYRWPKAGGAVELIADYFEPDSSYFMRDLVVDDSHVFWLASAIGNELLEEPGEATLRKTPKDGGAITIIATAGDGLDDARAISADNTHLYFTEIGTGRVGKLDKNGNGLTFLAPAHEHYMGGAIAVNDTQIFYSDTTGGYDGRIRRLPIGGGAIDDIVLGALGPGGVHLTDSHVYWTMSGGVYRLPLNANGVAVDLVANNLEITQTVQDLESSVMLVAEKPTFVRFYASLTEVHGLLPGVTVSAELHGERNGAPLPDSPLTPIDPELYLKHNAPIDRFDRDTTFNFWLPPSWLDGSVEFRAVVNPSGAVNEFELNNNELVMTRTFLDQDPLCVEMVQVETSPTTASAGDPGFVDIVNSAEAQLPFPEILIDVGGKISETQVCWAGIFPYPCGGPYELDDMQDDWKVLARLGWYDIWHNHNQWQQCGKAHFFGMVHPDETSSGGLGNRPGYNALGVMNVDPDFKNLQDVAPWYAPHGGSTLAHELGHNKNRKHVDCGDPASTDNNYPYNPCTIGVTFSNTHNFGFDSVDNMIIGTSEAGDLLSYAMSTGIGRWPSDYTYEAILDYPFRSSARYAPAAIAAGETLAITGVYTPTTGKGDFEFGFVLPGNTLQAHKVEKYLPNVDPEVEPLQLILRDGGNGVISADNFTPPALDDTDNAARPFTLIIPWDANTASVELADGNGSVVSRPVSANPPVVEVTSPNGGESFAGSLDVEWTASDDDGDDLVYTVQYSADDGTTWHILATDIYTPALSISDTSFIPGSKGMTALVRVIASDGLRTGSDVSDRGFSLRNNPPLAHIDAPRNGATFPTGMAIRAEGGAWDEEDGSVDSTNGLQWTLDGNAFGAGEEILMSDLTVGVHSLELRATDSGNLVDETAINFIIKDQMCSDNREQLHIAFLIDYSDPEMTPWNPTACSAIPTWVSDLEAMGMTVAYDVIGINGQQLCATTSVRAIDPDNSVNDHADWGAAIESVSAHLDWKDDYTRVIVPISNQGPQDGNPVNEADVISAENAVTTALANNVAVVPLLAPPLDSQSQPLVTSIAHDIAQGTSGDLLLWEDRDEMPAVLQGTQAALGCQPEVDSVPQRDPNDPTAPITLVGDNLWRNTHVMVNGDPATAVETSADGRLIQFEMPASRGRATETIVLSRAGAEPLTVQLTNGVPTAVAVRTTSSTTATPFMLIGVTLLLFIGMWFSKWYYRA